MGHRFHRVDRHAGARGWIWRPARCGAPRSIGNIRPVDVATMIRVFLADDHPVVREGLKRLLLEHPDITATSSPPNTVSIRTRRHRARSGHASPEHSSNASGQTLSDMTNAKRDSGHPRCRSISEARSKLSATGRTTTTGSPLSRRRCGAPSRKETSPSSRRR